MLRLFRATDNNDAKEKQRSDGLIDILDIGEEVRAVSAKGGLMMGTKKVGAFSSPLKKANIIIALEKQK
ncbi:MAG: hypothetical protein ABSG73_02030 [Candidatus Aminicenantales bacterium]